MKDNSFISIVAAICFFVLFLGFRAWLADGDIKCFFAKDPATCATIKEK